jgi:hypothetical protein
MQNGTSKIQNVRRNGAQMLIFLLKCFVSYAYVFSSTKLEIRAEQVLPGSEGGKGERGWGRREGGRSDPNNV